MAIIRQLQCAWSGHVSTLVIGRVSSCVICDNCGYERSRWSRGQL